MRNMKLTAHTSHKDDRILCTSDGSTSTNDDYKSTTCC